ncbi:MAG: hypothetical protein RL220_737 [Bacteroidota bacterium]
MSESWSNGILLFEDAKWKNFAPLTLTRPVSELRIGIGSIAEKWSSATGALNVSPLTRPGLRDWFPPGPGEILVNARLIPQPDLVERITQLGANEALEISGEIIAARCHPNNLSGNGLTKYEWIGEAILIDRVTDLFTLNDKVLRLDFKRLDMSESQGLPEGNQIIGPADQLFVAPGAKVLASVINTSTGPVYIGNDAEIMEGCMIRGPFALGDHATLKMGAKIYGASTIGPHCKVGGEFSNSVMFGFSNKAHDGFIGNSVIGEWCNLGADTNNSNLRNDYGSVKLWSGVSETFEDTGLTFCGLIMGDHSKAGINSMFNTGTVVGVSCNLFGGDFLPKYIPSFSWGGAGEIEVYRFDKAMEVASRMMERRNVSLTDTTKELLKSIAVAEGRFEN